MTPGTHSEIGVLRYGKAGQGPKAYIQAAVHANELPGAMLMHHLMPMLNEAQSKGLILGEIVLVPTVNPIGLAQLVGNQHLGRYDLLSYGNFNRNWLDLTSEVARRIGKKLGQDSSSNVKLIRAAALASLRAMKPMNALQTLRVEVMKHSIDADIVLDLHCDLDAALHLFGSDRDLGGPFETLAADLGVQAAMCGENSTVPTFSGVHSSLWSQLASRFPEARIPQACLSVTVELRSQHDVSDALGAADANNVYRYLTRRGVIKGDAGKVPRAKAVMSPIAGMDVGYCPKAGFLVFRVKPGDKVREGDIVCEIIDPHNPNGPSARTAMRSNTHGVLFARRLPGTVAWPGSVAYRISGPKALAHRVGMTGLDD